MAEGFTLRVGRPRWTPAPGGPPVHTRSHTGTRAHLPPEKGLPGERVNHSFWKGHFCLVSRCFAKGRGSDACWSWSTPGTGCSSVRAVQGEPRAEALGSGRPCRPVAASPEAQMQLLESFTASCCFIKTPGKRDTQGAAGGAGAPGPRAWLQSPAGPPASAPGFGAWRLCSLQMSPPVAEVCPGGKSPPGVDEGAVHTELVPRKECARSHTPSHTHARCHALDRRRREPPLRGPEARGSDAGRCSRL